MGTSAAAEANENGQTAQADVTSGGLPHRQDVKPLDVLGYVVNTLVAEEHEQADNLKVAHASLATQEIAYRRALSEASAVMNRQEAAIGGIVERLGVLHDLLQKVTNTSGILWEAAKQARG